MDAQDKLKKQGFTDYEVDLLHILYCYEFGNLHRESKWDMAWKMFKHPNFKYEEIHFSLGTSKYMVKKKNGKRFNLTDYSVI